MLFNVTIPLPPVALSLIVIAPVADAVIVVALVGLAAAMLIPTEPAVRLMLAAFNAPLVLIPLAAALPLRVNELPELAPSEILPLLVSMMLTAPPVALALNVPDDSVLAPVKFIPAEPVVSAAVGAVSVPAAVMPLLA